MKLISYSPLRTPLARARGWGSAHAGAHHWWAARLSSLALIPLTGWFVWSVLHLTHAGQMDVVAFLQRPVNAVAMALFVAVSCYHGAMGLQVVLEDYVGHASRIVALILIKGVAFLLAIASLYAIFLMSFSGGVQ